MDRFVSISETSLALYCKRNVLGLCLLIVQVRDFLTMEGVLASKIERGEGGKIGHHLSVSVLHDR